LKAATATTDGKSGPPRSQRGGSREKGGEEGRRNQPAKKKKDDKPLAPDSKRFRGPVYVFITHGDASAPINALMQKRAFQISDYTFTGLPQKRRAIRARAAASHASSDPATPDAPPTKRKRRGEEAESKK